MTVAGNITRDTLTGVRALVCRGEVQPAARGRRKRFTQKIHLHYSSVFGSEDQRICENENFFCISLTTINSGDPISLCRRVSEHAAFEMRNSLV